MTPPNLQQQVQMLRSLASRAEFLTHLVDVTVDDRRCGNFLRERKALRWAVAELAGDQREPVIEWAQGKVAVDVARAQASRSAPEPTSGRTPLRLRLESDIVDRIAAVAVHGESVTEAAERLLLGALEHAERSDVAVAASIEGARQLPPTVGDASTPSERTDRAAEAPGEGVPVGSPRPADGLSVPPLRASAAPSSSDDPGPVPDRAVGRALLTT